MNEFWSVKENGGEGELVGIMSSKSDWFIAEEILLNHAELICRLFNASQQGVEADGQNTCKYCENLISSVLSHHCKVCGRKLPTA